MNESRNTSAQTAKARADAAARALGPIDLDDTTLEAVARRMLAYWLAGSEIDGTRASSLALGAHWGIAPSAIRAALARMRPFPGPRTVATRAVVSTYRAALAGKPVEPVLAKTQVDAYRQVRQLRSWGRPRKDAT